MKRPLTKKQFNDGDRVCSLVYGQAHGIPAKIIGKSNWIYDGVQNYILLTEPIPGHPDGLKLSLPGYQIGLIDEQGKIMCKE